MRANPNMTFLCIDANLTTSESWYSNTNQLEQSLDKEWTSLVTIIVGSQEDMLLITALYS